MNWTSFAVCLGAAIATGRSFWEGLIGCMPHLIPITPQPPGRPGPARPTADPATPPINWAAFNGCVVKCLEAGDSLWTAIGKCLPMICSPGTTPPPPPPPPPPPADPLGTRVRLRHGNSGCTGTLVRFADDPAALWILTAAHCVPGVGAQGTATATTGATSPTVVTAHHPRADVALLRSTFPTTLPHAEVGRFNAPPGTKVWHAGYGVNVPGNVERGVIERAFDSNSQCMMTLAASPGDSGSGIYREDDRTIASVVCCGSGRSLWGGNVEAIRTLLKLSFEYLDDDASTCIPIPCLDLAAKPCGCH